ncbi:MAG TPA: NAD(P)-dependent oxidoreductase [Nocardioidaceae bacterium]|nr:NAD(P)-dependent oxidoreductase [Nocardioidaceae bacterium]
MIGATGVIGTSAVRALAAAGHDVVGLARTPEKAARLELAGARAVQTDLFDPDGLARMFDGADAVCNLTTHVPVGYGAARAGAWRENDRLRTEGVRRVVDAARTAGVRRIVQESVSFLYADNADGWITEQSPVEINRATEPASVGESRIQDYACRSRSGVVLRFGTIVGDDRLTRWTLRSARHGRPVGLGRPGTWAHVVHTDDLGPAVVAALTAPSGIYNVGAEPVRRGSLVQGYADAVGQDSGDFLGPVLRRLAGSRIEPLTRSLRVSSEHFTAQTGWTPRRATFDASWFDVIDMESKAVR